MNRWYRLSQSAAKAALKYRLEIGLPLDAPCDIYETIRTQGIDLQFMDIPSLEGMFLEEPEATRICVTAHRPWGRQRFTAAHEIGHCVLGHGTQVDDVIEARHGDKDISDEEILAEGFARFLLMPPRAVARAFATNKFDKITIYKASCWLGVGYESLVKQLAESLELISAALEQELLKVNRQELCQQLLADPGFKADLWMLDPSWSGRTVHVQIGDVILGISTKGNHVLSPLPDGGAIIQSVGETCAAILCGGEVLIRASRRSFVGFYDYRYLPE